MLERLVLAIGLLMCPALTAAAQCTAASGTHRVPLLELYTSEGCDSCPPADRWVSGLPARGLTPERVVTLAFHVDYCRPGAQGYLALYENRLATQVAAGENRGRRLAHDYVVREMAGPFPSATGGTWRFEHRFRIDRAWKRADLRVAAFVQDEKSGEVLQALVLGAACG